MSMMGQFLQEIIAAVAKFRRPSERIEDVLNSALADKGSAKQVTLPARHLPTPEDKRPMCRHERYESDHRFYPEEMN